MKNQDLPEGFSFHELGLSDHDGDLEFYVPRKTHKVNYSSVKAPSEDARKVRCPVKRLKSITEALGHHRLDVLKMDIEGGEMVAIPDLLDSGVFVGQLLAEFHYHYPVIGWTAFVELMARVHNRGYRIFHVSRRGYEFSLVHESLLP